MGGRGERGDVGRPGKLQGRAHHLADARRPRKGAAAGCARVFCAARRARTRPRACTGAVWTRRGPLRERVAERHAARQLAGCALAQGVRVVAQVRVRRPAVKEGETFALVPACVQVKVITEIRKNETGDRIKVERTVKVRCALLRAVAVCVARWLPGSVRRRSRPTIGPCCADHQEADPREQGRSQPPHVGQVWRLRWPGGRCLSICARAGLWARRSPG